MAKRAPADEMTYNPLDATLAQSVIKPASEAASQINRALQAPSHLISTRKMTGTTNLESVAGEKSASLRGFTRAKRVLLTLEEEHQVERLVRRVAEELGASLKLSHVLRACLAVLCHGEEEILAHAKALAPLTRPANGDAVALAQFEQAIARLLSLALRDAPPMR